MSNKKANNQSGRDRLTAPYSGDGRQALREFDELVRAHGGAGRIALEDMGLMGDAFREDMHAMREATRDEMTASDVLASDIVRPHHQKPRQTNE